MLRSRALNIHRPCPGDAQIDHGTSFCHSCNKSVHELSRLSEREAYTLLNRHRGAEICVSYRVDAAGRPIFRAQPAPSFRAEAVCVMILSVALAACTPWGLNEAGPQVPGQAGECVLVEDGVWECRDDTLDLRELEGIEEGVEGGCAQAVEASGITMGGITVSDTVAMEPTKPASPTMTEGAGPIAIVDFEIDTSARVMRGAMVSSVEGIGDRLEYTPTVDLIAEWKARRAERVAQRQAAKTTKRANKHAGRLASSE